MRKILSVLTAIIIMISCFTIFVSAATKVGEFDEGYILVSTSDLKYVSSTGAVETPGAEGAEWGLFPYWEGYRGTQIYDTHGSGMYVETTINCSAFKLCIGNGGGNGHTNIEVYVDGEKIDTLNATTYEDGKPWQKDYPVTPGNHTIKILAGTPAAEGWNGFTFNAIAYIPAELPDKKAEVKFYNSNGEEETPGAEGAEWGLFPYWAGYKDQQVYDNHGSGMYVETTVNCSSFMVCFGNGGENSHTNIEIYVDGEKIDSTPHEADIIL